MHWKTLPTAALLLVCSMLYPQAYAKCINRVEGNEVPFHIASIPVIGRLEFNPGDYAIGQTIGTPITGTIIKNNNNTLTTNCPPSTAVIVTGHGTPSMLNGRQIFPTSINGLGVAISMIIGQNTPSIPTKLFTTNFTGNSTLYWSFNQPFILEWIKTGEITAQGVLQGPIMYYREGNAFGENIVEIRFSNAVEIKPRTPTCTVDASSSQHVTLEKVYSTEMSGVNSASSKGKDFQIRLLCGGGDNGTATRAFVTLTDSMQPGNTGNVLTVQQNGLPAGEVAARGVGIQIIRNDGSNAVLPFSNAVDPSAPSTWHAGTIAQGQSGLTIPLRARYVQTGPQITAGKIYARATFTVSYH